MSVTRDQIVAEAISWLDTPFHHQARLKGVGVDCVGLVIGTAHALGISGHDTVDYARMPDPVAMRAQLAAHLDEVPFRQLRVGDVLWFRVVHEPQHLGIVIDLEPLTMIHAYQRPGVDRVITQRLDGFWRKRIAGCWRFRGIE